MTESAILENKKLINLYVDMTSNIIKIDRSKVRIDNYILVEDNIEMSIDAIAEAAYGTNEALDILCKFNGIGNPLSIKTGDVIAIPNLSSLMSNVKRVNVKTMALAKTDKQILKTTITGGSTNSPSKKQRPSKNFSKSKDGILVF